MVHVRFEGKSYDISERDLALGRVFTDQALFEALARRLEVGDNRLSGHVVDRRPSGDLIVHPEAVYG